MIKSNIIKLIYSTLLQLYNLTYHLIYRGGLIMRHNESIGCTVTECKFHCQDDNYCTLNHIQIVTHNSCAYSKECTDCGSFVKK